MHPHHTNIIAATCVKCKWNAQDCVTGIHERRNRSSNLITPVECDSLSFRANPCVFAFTTHKLCINGIELAFVWWIWHINITFSYIFFKITICFIALIKSLWNMRFKRTWHSNGVANGVVHNWGAYSSAYHDCMLFKNPNSHRTMKRRQRCW